MAKNRHSDARFLSLNPVVPTGVMRAICDTQGCRELMRFSRYHENYCFQNVIKPQSNLIWALHWMPQIIFSLL